MTQYSPYLPQTVASSFSTDAINNRRYGAVRQIYLFFCQSRFKWKWSDN